MGSGTGKKEFERDTRRPEEKKSTVLVRLRLKQGMTGGRHQENGPGEREKRGNLRGRRSVKFTFEGVSLETW